MRFIGCLIAESLFDPGVVADWAPFAERAVAVPEDPDATLWHVRWYQVAEGALRKRLAALAEAMRPNWYGHFWAEGRLCVILPGEVFWLPTEPSAEWEAMIEYGESMGVERRWTASIPTTMPEWVAEALRAAEAGGLEGEATAGRRAEPGAAAGEPGRPAEPDVADGEAGRPAVPPPADANRAPHLAREAARVASTDRPRTRRTLAADLRAGGLRPGMHLLVHTRLSAIGWTAGGPVAVIQALQEALSPAGTLVMPAFTGHLSDPAHWSRPPVPADWWETIRREMPPFDSQITPTRGLGQTAELFRTFPGVRRSGHPHLSLSAWGQEAHYLTADHRLEQDLGDESPLGRLYRLDGWTLFLGTDFRTCTAFHLSEHRSGVMAPERQGAPLMTADGPRWIEWESLSYDSDRFPAMGEAYLAQAAEADVRRFKVGSAVCLLLRLRPLIDFGTDWLRQQR